MVKFDRAAIVDRAGLIAARRGRHQMVISPLVVVRGLPVWIVAEIETRDHIGLFIWEYTLPLRGSCV